MMEFDDNVWDVSTESSQLTDRLFGTVKSSPKTTKKAKKRKSKSPSDQSPSPAKKAKTSKPQLDTGQKETPKVPVVCVKKETDKKRRKKTADNTKPPNSVKSQLQQDNVKNPVTNVNRQNDSKKVKESVGLTHISESLTTPVKESEMTAASPDDKKKKKRKRKCKKNKFKDYSSEIEEKKEIKKIIESVDMTKSTKYPKIDNEVDPVQSVDQAIADKKNLKLKKKLKNKIESKIREGSNLVTDIEGKVTNGVVRDKSELSKKSKKKKMNKSQGLETVMSQKMKNTPLLETVTPPKSQIHKIKSPFNAVQLQKVLSGNSQPATVHLTADEISSQMPNSLKNKHTNKNGMSEDSRSKPMSLLEKSKERLKAARFRYLNEQMYTSTGKEAFAMFKQDKEAFNVYHEGFQGQVAKWPINPIDVIIEYVKTRPQHQVVADFGCGDAKLSRSVPNKVHSFDLVALHDSVKVCDMSKVPLKDCSVDIAVFCLSLMGTNLTSYLQEANRVLRPKGTLKIAEVTSRFKNLGGFILQVEKMGFKITDQDSSNKMFVLLDFRKSSSVKSSPDVDIQLNPCVYKKR